MPAAKNADRVSAAPECPPGPPPGLRVGAFLERPNRFLAVARTGRRRVRCHMPNPGRMKELLVPGTPLLLRPAKDPGRKTDCSVVAVWYAGQWVSLVSTAGNDEVASLIEEGGVRELRGVRKVRREFTLGLHRYDIVGTGRGRPWLIEVKSCTLVEDGHARFPDAPTVRGAAHMDGLRQALGRGYRCAAVIFIPRTDAKMFSPNEETDPVFAEAMRRAASAGVKVIPLRFGFDGEGYTYLGRVRAIL